MQLWAGRRNWGASWRWRNEFNLCSWCWCDPPWFCSSLERSLIVTQYKKGGEKAIVSYYSSFVVLFPLSMRSLWPHSLRLLPNKKQKAEEKFSAFLAYAIKSRTEKKTIGQQLPKIQSCRDWEDSLLSLTLHSVWKRQKISELFLIWRDPVPVVCRYPIWFLKSSEYFFSEEMRPFLYSKSSQY